MFYYIDIGSSSFGFKIEYLLFLASFDNFSNSFSLYNFSSNLL